MSLPRVSTSGSKRPDHVYQFRSSNNEIILSIESKEIAARVEHRIGPRLVRYVQELVSSPASAERISPNGSWGRTSKTISVAKFDFASAVAFLIEDNEEILSTRDDIEVDLVFGIKMIDTNKSAKVILSANSPLGQRIADLVLGSFEGRDLNLSIELI